MNSDPVAKTCFLLAVLLSFITLPACASELQLRVIDDLLGIQVPARVLLRGSDGVCRVPEGVPLLKIARDVWFTTEGSYRVDLPPGRTELRVERGKEYIREKVYIDIPTEGTIRREVRLKRWIDMRSAGYKSLENHLHLAPDMVGAFCAAEDLDFGTVLQWWNRPAFGVPPGSGHIRKIAFGGVTVPTTIYDVEVEYEWGAIYMLGLPNPFPFLNDPSIPNLPAARYGCQRGTLNCYQGGWSREVLVDALLDLVDVVNLCNNNFAMHRFQPRSIYSNLLEVEGFPIYPDTPEGMLQMNLETYYRLLNCGLKLAAGAGSATGVKAVPPGFNRAYVRCAVKEGLEEVLDHWRQGQNFVTNGPMLFFRGPGGVQPGDSLSLEKEQGKLEFEIEAISDCPLGSVELVVNGEVAGKLSPGPGQKRIKGKISVPAEESFWVCALATDRDTLLTDEELAGYDEPPGRWANRANRLRFAHTSPIYVKIGGRIPLVERSLREALSMLKAFERFAIAKCSPDYLDELLKAVEKGRGKISARLKKFR